MSQEGRGCLIADQGGSDKLNYQQISSNTHMISSTERSEINLKIIRVV